MNPVTKRKTARILALRAAGLNNRQIADKLHIALREVDDATSTNVCLNGSNLNLGDPTRADVGLKRFSFIKEGRWALSK